MKNIHAALLLLLLTTTTTLNAQIVNRTIFYNKVQFDSLIRITEGAGNGKVLTSDGNGVATWQVNTAIDIAGPPTQILYFADDSTVTSDSFFVKTALYTRIGNLKGDTLSACFVGLDTSVIGTIVSGNILTDNSTFAYANLLRPEGLFVGDLLQSPYYLPLSDGLPGQYIVTDGAGNCTGGGITGRVVYYAGGAWRRIPIE